MTSTSMSALSTAFSHAQTTESKHYEKENRELKLEIERLKVENDLQKNAFGMALDALIQDRDQQEQILLQSLREKQLRIRELTQWGEFEEKMFEDCSKREDLYRRTAYRMAYRKTLSMPSDPAEQKKLIETYMQDTDDPDGNHAFVEPGGNVIGRDVGEMDDPYVIGIFSEVEQKESDIMQQVVDHVARGLTVESDMDVDE